MITRKDKIELYLKEYTESAIDTAGIDITGITASEIAETLLIDRTTSSRELNSLYNDGIAMKFLGRPTHYLHYPTVLSTLTTHVPSTIPVGLSLRDLNTSNQTSPQENAESTDTLDMPLQFKPYDLSFKHAAELSETVIRYPRPELHCLLILPDPDLGNTLAASMFNYGQQINRFPSNSKLHTYECHFVLKNISAYNISLQLFGTTATNSTPAKKGLLEKSSDSMLFFNNIQHMPPSIDDRFSTLLLQNTFSRHGEDNFIRRNNTLIVASCSKEAYDNQESAIFQYFPMKIFFPAMHDWTAEDLFHHICLLFQKQADILNLKIKLRKDVLYYLLCVICTETSVSIQSRIKQLCAIAYTKNRHNDTDTIEIYPEYLTNIHFGAFNHTERASELLAFLNKHVQTSVVISKDSIPLIFATPAPVIPTSALGGAMTTSPVSNYLQNNLEIYLENMCHTRSTISKTDSRSLCASPLFDVIQKSTRFSSVSSNSILISWGAQLLDIFLENTRNSKSILPFESDYIKEDMPNDILQLAEQLAKQIKLSLLSDSQYHLFVLYASAILHTIYQWHTNNNILLAVIYKDPDICTNISKYLDRIYHIPIYPLYWSESSDDTVYSQINALLKKHQANHQLIIFSDDIPLTELDSYIERVYHISAKYFPNSSLHFMNEVLEKITQFHYSLPMLSESSQLVQKDTISIPNVSTLILQAVQHLLEPSLNFIDIYKTLPLLRDSLKEITASLKCTATDELTIKYFFHCAHMIERLIRKEPLHYPGIKIFTNQHHSEFNTIEYALQPLAQYYGFKTPAAELAYITEIFL